MGSLTVDSVLSESFHLCRCYSMYPNRSCQSPPMSLIIVQPSRLLSGQTQWAHVLLLYFSYSEKSLVGSANAFGCQCFIPFYIQHFFFFLSVPFFNDFAHSLSQTYTDGWFWSCHLWAQCHCKVCPPSWLLPPYCPPSVCAAGFCVNLAGIVLFTVNKWEQKAFTGIEPCLLEWRTDAVHTLTPELWISLRWGFHHLYVLILKGLRRTCKKKKKSNWPDCKMQKPTTFIFNTLKIRI